MNDKHISDDQIAMQISRIREMELYLGKADAAVKALNEAISVYEEISDQYRRLEEYYGSAAWMEDFEADEQGLFPANLKRGVLSEDAVYNLIFEHKKMFIRMSHLLDRFNND